MNTYMCIHWVCLDAFFALDEKHRALLTTCERVIASGSCVLVFYTHHRPNLAERDMEFFTIACESRWECEKVLTERFAVRVSVFCSPLAE